MNAMRYVPLITACALVFQATAAAVHAAAAATPAPVTVATHSGTLTAPGRPKQAYVVTPVDTTQFKNGGKLVISIVLGNGNSGGSFDVFREGLTIPKQGRPIGTLGGAYDIKPGGKPVITIIFTKGQVYQFGATGNWFSPVGATNTYSFTAVVTPNPAPK